MQNSKCSAAILGAGPTAGYVYAALRDCGFGDIRIITDKINPPPKGRTWFGWIPPAIQDKLEPDPIYFIGLGTKKDYMARMARPVESPSTYPENKIDVVQGFDPSIVQDILLDHAQDCIRFVPYITDDLIYDIAGNFDQVFVTFPTERSLKEQPERIVYWNLVSDEIECEPHPHVVMYNGTTNAPWTRYIMMFGVASWEFSHTEYPNRESLPEPGEGTHYETTRDFAPGTNLWPTFDEEVGNVHLIGRWARWDKKWRVEYAYQDAMNVLSTAAMMVQEDVA